jgi:rare lipoprotein A
VARHSGGVKARHRNSVLAALAAATVVVAPFARAGDDAAAPRAVEDATRHAAKPALDRSGRKRTGVASVYAHRFVGRKMADGTRMSADDDNAASRTLPLGTEAQVTNLKTGQSAKVTIQDRGPYAKGRIVDLSPATADKIGITRKQGIAKVEVRPITLPPPDRDAQR